MAEFLAQYGFPVVILSAGLFGFWYLRVPRPLPAGAAMPAIRASLSDIVRAGPWGRTIPLATAARRLYERSRGTDFGLQFERDTPEKTLDSAGLYILYTIGAEAKKTPSERREVLKSYDTDRLLVADGATTLTDIDSDAPIYREPRVDRGRFAKLLADVGP